MPMSRPASYTDKLYFSLQREQSTQALALSSGAIVYPALKSLRQSKDTKTVPLRCSAYSYENQLIQLCGVLGQETKYPPPVSYQYDGNNLFIGNRCIQFFLEAHAIPPHGAGHMRSPFSHSVVFPSTIRRWTSGLKNWLNLRTMPSVHPVFVEVAYLTALASNLVLVISDITGLRPPVIGGEQISETEYACLERAINYLRILANSRGVPVFSDISEGLNHVKKMIMDCRLEERRKSELQPISTYELFLVDKITSICNVFKSLQEHSPGYVTVEQAHIGLQRLGVDLPCDFRAGQVSSHLIGFRQFCQYYITYTRQHAIRLRERRIQCYSLSVGDAVKNRVRRASFPLSLDCQTGPLSSGRLFNESRGCRCMLDAYLSLPEFAGHYGIWSSLLKHIKSRLRGRYPLICTNVDMLPCNWSQFQPLDTLVRFGQWAQVHSRVLFFFVGSNSFSLATMMEAAFSIGSGLNVVLCVEPMGATVIKVDAPSGLRQQHQRDCAIDSLFSHLLLSKPVVRKVNGSDRKPNRLHVGHHLSDCFDVTRSNRSSSLSNQPYGQLSPNESRLRFATSPVGNVSSDRDSWSSAESPTASSSSSSVQPTPSTDSGLGMSPSSSDAPDTQFSVSPEARFTQAAWRVQSFGTPATFTGRSAHMGEQAIMVSLTAMSDHNRGRTYLSALGRTKQIPVCDSVDRALDACLALLAN
ncbi:hypothetical protein PHET_07888 [Paragonimus heterotremus]|uniref:Uncharacterized protein n=1 Tax=Paragonimus heterotremus TaxID=100268 RepID=A0A8J4T9I1_9TREM|nr:hypothetical protein PHET_07888 [Paragonimus heterotremus]